MDANDPLNPANRRIVIMVLNAVAESNLDAQSEAGLSAGTPPPELIPDPEPLEIF